MPLQLPPDYFIGGPDLGQTFQQNLLAAQQAKAEQAQKAAEQARQAQLQKDLDEASQSPTVDKIRALVIRNPGLLDKFNPLLEGLSEDRRAFDLETSTQVFSAFTSGKIDIGKKVIENAIARLENKGDKEGVQKYRDLLESYEADPESAAFRAGIFGAAAATPEKWAESLKTVEEERRKRGLEGAERRTKEAEANAAVAKHAAELNLTSAQVNKVLAETRKLDAESRKIAVDLEAMKAGGIVDPEKRFDKEMSLRKEYTALSKGMMDARDAMNKIKEASKISKGAGDIALVTSFMKMLDPGSVVREGEFAKAADTAGLLSTLQNKAAQLQKGSFLSDEQRKDFVTLAEKYFNSAVTRETEIRSGLQTVVKNYGLNSENIFGITASPVRPSADAGTDGRADLLAPPPGAVRLKGAAR